MPPTPELRRILATFLDLDELDRDPATFATWIESNELTTALAHLAARAGDKSFLLRCLAAGVLRVAVEDADAHALAINVAGRVGVVVHDHSVDARAVTVDADGHAGAYLLSRNASLGAIGTLPRYGAIMPTAAAELDHAGGGVETHDFGSATVRALVITAMAAPVACYGAASAGAKDSPLGICTAYGPLITACEHQYLDLESTVAGVIHILDYPVDQPS